MKAIVSLGANLGDRTAALHTVLRLLDALPGTDLLRVSSFYETKAVGVEESQPDYINCVAELKSRFSPSVLLGMCLGIETARGRTRPGIKSPRLIDIDLLLCADDSGSMIKCDSWELTLPHPRMNERLFVLAPLKELFPDERVFGMDFSAAFEKCSGQSIRMLEEV